MENNTAKIAILLATYNGEKYIEELLDSIMSQSMQDFVCYIHDDGSTDRTTDIIKTYLQNYKDKIVVLDYLSKKGCTNNFLSLAQHVSHEYAMFCDQDDVWKNDKIEKTYKKIKQMENDHPGVPLLVFTDLSVVDEEQNILDDSFMHYKHYNVFERIKFNKALLESPAAGCTMMFNKLLLRYASIIENIDIDNIIMHDYWYFLIAACSGRVGYIDESTIFYRQHGKNVCGTTNASFWQRRKADLANIRATSLTAFIRFRKKWIKDRRLQIAELLKLKIPNNQFSLCEQFVESGNFSYFRRQLFYLKKGIYSKGTFFRLFFFG